MQAILEEKSLARTTRLGVSVYFFISGFVFATWASRIPAIQQKLQINEAQLGTALFAMPLGLMLTLPLVSLLLGKYRSRTIMLAGSTAYCLLLAMLGWVNNYTQFLVVLFLFGASRNMMNIPVNAQGVGVQRMYTKSIISTFHGIWSLAGFGAASVGGIMISHHISPSIHFGIAALMSLTCVWLFYSKTYKQDAPTASTEKRKAFALPNAQLMPLALVAFACMACEGTMYDWSGVYFKKVVEAPIQYQALGYMSFMCTVSIVRFLGDWFVNQYGIKKVMQSCALFLFSGLVLAVSVPNFIVATIGFAMAGVGVSCIIPLTFALASKQAGRQTSGQILASIATISNFGFLLGPPIIGYIAEATNLRWSFLFAILLGLYMYVQIRKLSE